MKLIKQSFEILEQKDFTIKGIKQFVERCARVSYKSEDKITDTSYEKFVNMLESRGHDRPLEFGTVHLKLTIDALDLFHETVTTSKVFNNQWIQWNIEEDSEDNEYYAYMTTNYRYYLVLLNEAFWLFKYLDSNDSEYYPKRYTVHMILDRGVMDEFRTHVGLSHLAESTRYCNYSKDKFGNELTFIQPCWDIRGTCFIDFLQNAEWGYFRMLKNGWTPQQARSILPLGIKSELISCGFEDAWKNFFYRRDAPDAHPMAQEIAKPMHQKFIELTKIE